MTTRKIRQWTAGVLLGTTLMLFVGGCELFNQVPIAQIAASVLSGASPLTVSFDASDSSDPDGLIVGYQWDFGDGETGTGVTVTHQFISQTPGSFTVTLTVIDNDGARSSTSQSIEIVSGSEPEPDGGEDAPTAFITADTPTIGLIPLTVTFDGSDSTAGSGSVIAYDWDFGDGSTATGARVTHTFEPERTEEFVVTLTVWNSGGLYDWEQANVIAIVPGAVTGDDEPTPELTVSDPRMTFESEGRPTIPSIFEVDFDPRGSYADAGHQIVYYVWDFGDGTPLRIEESDVEVTHRYELRTLSRTYVVRLTVYDDQGLEAAVTSNVTLTDPEGQGDIDDD